MSRHALCVILTRQEARRVRGGRKTEHRIARSRVAPTAPVIPITYHEANPALGYTRAGEPRTNCVRECYVRVLGIAEGRISDATEADARAEGYACLADLLERWEDPRARVWIISWEVDPSHRPRYLSRTVIAGKQSDYVDVPTRALDDLEAVDEVTLARITRKAREREADRASERRAQRDALSFDAQIAACTVEARERYIDIRSELRAIKRWTEPAARRKQLDSIKRKLDQEAIAA